jgi:hypothetical protein
VKAMILSEGALMVDNLEKETIDPSGLVNLFLCGNL